MIPKADVLFHNFRPGVLERLGFDTATLHALRPDLVVARSTGFGQAGPMCGGRAYDPIVQAASGMVRWGEDGPVLAPPWILDKTAGLYAMKRVHVAMFELALRQRSGVVHFYARSDGG